MKPVQEAFRAIKLRKGKPTEADIPRPTPYPGPKRKALAGQLDLGGRETPAA